MTDLFIHPQALCESTNIGRGTRIWAFAHILPGAQIGQDCNICDGVFIENDVVVGDRVTLKCGVQLWDGLRLQDDVFVGPNVSFANDRFPRSKVLPERFLPTRVERGASIGAGAVILPGICIGAGAMVGAGAVVTRSVPANAIVVGNPARIKGYTETQIQTATPEQVSSQGHALGVGGARLCRFPILRTCVVSSAPWSSLPICHSSHSAASGSTVFRAGRSVVRMRIVNVRNS